MKQGFTVTWSANQVVSNTLDMGDRGFDIVMCNNEAGAQISFQGSFDNSNFYTINREDDATPQVSFTTLSVGSGLSGRWVQLESLRSFQYVRVVATATAAGNNVYFATTINN